MKVAFAIVVLLALGSGIYYYLTVAQAEHELNVLYLDTRQAYLFDQDYEETLRGLHQLVDADYPLAFYELGRMYERGEGVAVDHSRAQSLYAAGLPLLRKAAEEGDDVARFYLGEMFRYGRGVAADPTLARRYFGDIDRPELIAAAEQHIREMAE